MEKHTPGPWRVEREDLVPVVWAHPNTYDIAICAIDWEPVRHQGPEDIDNGTAIGNARLIAAAPDLLAALELVTTDHDGMVLLNSGIADAIRAAIARARSY